MKRAFFAHSHKERSEKRPLPSDKNRSWTDARREAYNNNHKIKNNSKGFILYNDLTVPANTTKPENYPNGFSIALAFEYGVGIVGENANDNPNAWAYNIHNYQFGWHFIKNGEKIGTYGYAGFEIYRHTANEIRKNLKSWVNEYFNSKK